MAKESLSHQDRLRACLDNEKLDRVPVALWRHFPVDDQSPDRLAKATLQFQATFDFDLIKVTPASSFCVKDWGSQDEWRGASEGTRDYIKFPVQRAGDWEKLKVLDPRKGFLGRQLECLRLIFKEAGNHTPVIQTIFSPLAQAKNLASRELLPVYARRDPEALHSGLKRITETTLRFVEEVKKLGVAGIFYAVQHAQYGIFQEEEYKIFGRPYDLEILNACRDLWLNIIHIHGEEVMFDQFVDYPIQVINWHDQDTPPSLSQARQKYSGVLCGGLQRERAMVLGTPEEIQKEARKAIAETNGEKFILGTGCVVPITAPYGNLLAARRVVESD